VGNGVGNGVSNGVGNGASKGGTCMHTGRIAHGLSFALHLTWAASSPAASHWFVGVQSKRKIPLLVLTSELELDVVILSVAGSTNHMRDQHGEACHSVSVSMRGCWCVWRQATRMIACRVWVCGCVGVWVCAWAWAWVVIHPHTHFTSKVQAQRFAKTIPAEAWHAVLSSQNHHALLRLADHLSRWHMPHSCISGGGVRDATCTLPAISDDVG
jgi:hypothetical protein